MLVWGVLASAIVASIASLDENGPVNFDIGKPGSALLDPTAAFPPLRFRATAAKASGTMRLSVELDLRPETESASSGSGGATSLAVVEATLLATPATGSGTTVTLERALGSSAGDPPLTVELETRCEPSGEGHCTADFELRLRRSDAEPSGRIDVTWTPTATLTSAGSADVSVSELP